MARILNQLGVLSTKLGQQGDPDRLFWIPGGRPLLIEFKRPGEQPRPLQRLKHERLTKLGYDVKTIDNEADAYRAVAEALGAAQLPALGSEVSS